MRGRPVPPLVSPSGGAHLGVQGPVGPALPQRERESFIRNNLHNGVVSGAARGQALLGPMWAGLTPDSKGDPTGDPPHLGGS
jgi:hypothetical protein